jgi:hypothetical protein
MKTTKFERSFNRTLTMRDEVDRSLKPLFDHCVKLAVHTYRDSKEPGRAYLARRAGLDLLYARRLARVR